MPSPQDKPNDLSAFQENAGALLPVQWLDPRSLREHPRQADLVGDMDPRVFAELAADIKAHGIQNALLVMGDFRTVVGGHQRLRAALHNKLKLVPCIVRNDLIDPDDPAVLELLVGDNYYRRHQSNLQQTKAAVALAEIECERKGIDDDDWGNPRKELIEKKVLSRLGGSLKNARRYILLAKAPLSIQESFERGLLPLVTGAAVAGLEPSKQEGLGEAVAELLEQTESSGLTKTKEKILETARAALDTAKKPKKRGNGIPRHTPMDPINGIKSGLQDHLKALETSREQIVTHINASDDIPKLLHMQILVDARSHLERVLEVLTEIDAAIAAEPTVSDTDDECEDTEPRTSCLVNHAIAVTTV